MKPDPLDPLLAEYSAQPLPSGSEPSAAAIWHEIDRRRERSAWSWLSRLVDLQESFAQPRLAVIALTVALVVGVVPAALASRTQNERRMARQSIHFEVFAVNSGSVSAVFTKPSAPPAKVRP